MGFQGQLSSVNLADILQTLTMNRQTGTLSVTHGRDTVQVYFDQGDVARASAPPIDGLPMLAAVLVRRNQLRAEHAAEVVQRARSTGQPLRDLVLAGGYVELAALDDACSWCIEEQVCPLFEWSEGEFTFSDGAPPPPLQGLDMVEMGQTRIATTNLVLEGTRRNDEWKRIRAILPDPNALLTVDNDGRTNLRQVQTDPEMLRLMRYLDGRRTLDQVARTAGLTRFDTWAMAAQLVSAGVARPCSLADVVTDAEGLRATGDLARARELLEIALAQTRVPEIMRPLAEISAQLNLTPRAVELYLELVQADQDAGDLERALADLDTVIRLSPDDPELHFDRAQVLGELGRPDEAAAAFVQAAQTYIATRDIPRAIDACHRAKNILPRAPDPHRYLARAYLLDGQTDNALVEYKALWHSLLTVARPRRALEQLQEILDSDCKFAAVKDQVLSHAGSSEAVKTSKAMRLLAYTVVGLVALAALVGTWEYYQRVVVVNKGDAEITALEKELPGRKANLLHALAIEELEDRRARYGTDRDLRERIDQLIRLVRSDLDIRAQAQLARGDALLAGSDFVGAERAYRELRDRYRGAAAATNAEARLEQVRQAQVRSEVAVQMTDAQRRWNALDWDGALAQLNASLARKDLPTALRQQLAETQVEWSAASRSAQRLSERARRIETSGNLREALDAWRRAGASDGDQPAADARDRVRSLERDLAVLIARQVQDAAIKGEAQRTFALIDELNRLAGAATGDGVKATLANLEVPFTLTVDHPRTILAVRRSAGGEQRITAPAGASGAWIHRVAYRLSETLTVAASRPGFTTATAVINATARQVAASVTLARGPLWRAELTGPASTVPVFAGPLLLVGTARATLEVIDPRLGTSRPVVFPDAVTEFRSPPVVLGGHAYVVLDDTLYGIDLTTRTRLWQWPTVHNRDERLTGGLWVHEHDLIQGQSLVFVNTATRGVAILAVDDLGRVTPYPGLNPGREPTAPAMADRRSQHTVMVVPAGNLLTAFDTTAITENSPARPLFATRMRGDLVNRPVLATVNGRAAALMSDATGLLIAADIELNTAESRRVIASWILDGSAPSGPAVAGGLAYVNVAEGRVLCLDLAQPGPARWRQPGGTGTFGTLVGDPVVGTNGIYVAGGNGILVCLDAATGRERWRCDLGQPVVGGLAIRDGKIYVPLRSGQLWCFEEGDD